MTIEENIRSHIHNMRGVKKLIFRITFKFFKMYIKSADEILEKQILEKQILELKQIMDIEKIKVRQNQIRLDRIEQNSFPDVNKRMLKLSDDVERATELHYVMLTDGVDLKIREALQK